ncbi:MAG: hypothetical protein ABWJ99_06855 [Caldimicrobium sp.]
MSIFSLNSCTDKVSKEFTCLDCHKIEIPLPHKRLSCSLCHGGSERAFNKESAHKGLKTFFTYNEIERICGKCHNEAVKNFKNSLHFTYERELKSIFKGFEFPLKVTNLYEFSNLEGDFESDEGLLIDFLKRRCLSCHIFGKGEAYPKTKRERGCFSCHKPHKISKPDDETCLSCHYSIRIGWDYYGYSPHPWFVDYRSPFVNGKEPERPYGIEAYQLKEDVHKEKGLKCLSCHNKAEIMFGKGRISCNTCHKKLSENIFHKKKILSKVRCEVCHASFLNQDALKICYLELEPDLWDWYELSFQESYEIENLVKKFIKGEKIKYVMSDKFTDKEKEGIWLCTLENRTILNFEIGRDYKKRLCIKRKERLKLVFEDKSLEGYFEACKVPHTIGKGDINRSLRILKIFAEF